jgi:phosphomannomutase / phosphoglucomutase
LTPPDRTIEVNKDIFREYDVRGIADVDLDDETVSLIGQAYAAALIQQGHSPRVGIGFDARGSSPRLFDALSRGIRSAGVDVVKLGLVPTPLVYFAVFTHEGLGGVIQITGSHNPAEYNGFKMMMGRDTLHGESIRALYTRIQNHDFVLATKAGEETEWTGLIAAYEAWVKGNIKPGARALKVVLDSGNGVAGVVAPDLVRAVFPAGQVIELFSEPDARFPNHHPDPTVEENLHHLIAAVREHGADLGVAYDGDGDRIGVVDGSGGIIWGDRLMILLARAVLSEQPGATIIGEVKCSQTLFDDIAAHGGVPVMSKVGHSLIKAKIKETGAKLAGEMSGHIFFNDRFFGFDDAIYTTCRLMEILTATDQSLSELMSDVPTTFATPELRVDCADSIKFEVPGKVALSFADRFPVNTIDGVRVNFGLGWGLVRASNTQPVLVLRAEATSPELRDQYLAALHAAIADALKA